MISFIPTEQDCQRNSEKVTNEFLFVIDCSGSMESKDKIGLARKAMLLFLKSLPTNCRFNIIRFGSRFEALFNDHVVREYNEVNMREAEALIKNISADLGGTELLSPLRWLKERKPSENGVRQIFLLTDGEVSNVSEITNICREMATYTRIFSFGLGHSVSDSSLINVWMKVSFSFYSQVVLSSKVWLVLPMVSLSSSLHILMRISMSPNNSLVRCNQALRM